MARHRRPPPAWPVDPLWYVAGVGAIVLALGASIALTFGLADHFSLQGVMPVTESSTPTL